MTEPKFKVGELIWPIWNIRREAAKNGLNPRVLLVVAYHAANLNPICSHAAWYELLDGDHITIYSANALGNTYESLTISST